MKNFVVGDIQGCYKGLRSLLKKANFRPDKDKLWAVGDLIARGNDSLSTMEYLYDLGPQFDTVLGNHDLHLIATAHGIHKLKAQDKLDKLVSSKQFPKYIEYLSSKKLALSPSKNILITHAGLYPHWSVKKALKLSNEVHAELKSENRVHLLKNMYGNQPDCWDESLESFARYRFIINAFTRMRYLNGKHQLDFNTKCNPSQAEAELSPWYMIKNPKLERDQVLLFGHWASLLGNTNKHKNVAKIHALDTGYVWGHKMSMYCIETKKIIRISQ